MDFLRKLDSKISLKYSDGSEVEFSTDYRLFVEYSTILTGDFTENEKIDKIIDFLKNYNLPEIEETLTLINELYFPSKKQQDDSLKQKNKNYNIKFDILWDLIFAGFLQQYNINLYTIDLDFSLFKKLMNGLKDTLFNEVLSCWEKNLNQKGMSKEEKQHINSIRKTYDLSLIKKSSCKTLEDRDKMLMDHVDKIFASAKKGVE